MEHKSISRNNQNPWVQILLISALLTSSALFPKESFSELEKIKRPNQYPSPTVKQPGEREHFDNQPWQENTLAGDLNGLRSSLAHWGVQIEVQYVSILMGNTRGGFDAGFVGGGPLGVTLTVDTEHLFGWEGGTLFADWEYFNWYSDRFSPDNSFDPSGSFVGVNTNFIDAQKATLNQLAQLYYQQSFFDDQFTLAFGKMDANVPFLAVEAAAAFQNSIAMYTPTLNAFIPTYPNESTGIVAAIGNEERISAKIGWFDGTSAAYDAATGITGPSTGSRGPESFFENQGNWWVVAQVDFAWRLKDHLQGSMGIGAWVQTGLVATQGTDTEGVSDVPGWYLQWQQTLWSPSQEISEDGGGLVYFGQLGWSDPEKNPVHWSLMTGFSATGIIPGRIADAVGLMFAHTQFTQNTEIYESILIDGTTGPGGGHETSLEAFYIFQWKSWAYFQPGVMWIHSPGGGSPAALKDDLLLYLLLGVDF
ncbi:MAG: hypothetical protein CL917_08615 [Deltaproteobacteria bacterium]|nr:hypothetical protein [Deltaproteobacteria bacterium]